MPLNLPLAARLRMKREHKGLTQSDLAAIVHLSPSTIQTCEQGIIGPRARIRITAWLDGKPIPRMRRETRGRPRVKS
jgi:DNA-binding XRE family transcriptional regulator